MYSWDFQRINKDLSPQMVISTFGYYCKIPKNTEKYEAFSTSVSAHGTVLLFIEKFVQCYNESLHQPECPFLTFSTRNSTWKGQR